MFDAGRRPGANHVPHPFYARRPPACCIVPRSHAARMYPSGVGRLACARMITNAPTMSAFHSALRVPLNLSTQGEMMSLGAARHGRRAQPSAWRPRRVNGVNRSIETKLAQVNLRRARGQLNVG